MRTSRNAATLGGLLALAVVGAAQLRGFLFLAAGLGLFVAAVVIQARQAMACLRRLVPSGRAVALVTAAYVGAASAVFAAVLPFADLDVELPPAQLVLWWWPLALSAAMVVGTTEIARRRVRRWAASRRSRAAGGNGAG